MNNQTTITFIKLGALMMALSVAFGAFGAHALKNVLDEHMTKVYHTAVEYQFYHSLGMFAVAFVSFINDDKKVKIAGYIMLASTAVFCGSLYTMTITELKWLGAITPIGGVGFIISWIMLMLSLNPKMK
ncbi:MAG: DUF423 domain-containing protein [Arcobacteraceae bacterium]|nr:DUF423 domain-containing protein [Arcobacteraceae bacterium]